MFNECSIRKKFDDFDEIDGKDGNVLIKNLECKGVDNRWFGIPLNAFYTVCKNQRLTLNFEQFKILVKLYEPAVEIASNIMIGKKRAFLDRSYISNQYDDNKKDGDELDTYSEKNEKARLENIKDEITSNKIIIIGEELQKHYKDLYSKEEIENCFKLANVYRDCRHPYYRFFDPEDSDNDLNFGEFCDFMFLLLVTKKLHNII